MLPIHFYLEDELEKPEILKILTEREWLNDRHMDASSALLHGQNKDKIELQHHNNSTGVSAESIWFNVWLKKTLPYSPQQWEDRHAGHQVNIPFRYTATAEEPIMERTETGTWLSVLNVSNGTTECVLPSQGKYTRKTQGKTDIGNAHIVNQNNMITFYSELK